MNLNASTTMPTYPATPELDKLKAVSNESQAQGQFLEWLRTQGLVLCQWWEPTEEDDDPAQYLMATVNTEQLLARYHEIDLGKVEQERRAVLDYVHKSYEELNKPTP